MTDLFTFLAVSNPHTSKNLKNDAHIFKYDFKMEHSVDIAPLLLEYASFYKNVANMCEGVRIYFR